MHDADATREVRRLRGEELVGRRLSDEIVDRGTVPGASLRLARRLRQCDSAPAARDIDEAMNSERIALANQQREAAIALEEARLGLDCAELAQLAQRTRAGHHDIGVEAGFAVDLQHEVAKR